MILAKLKQGPFLELEQRMVQCDSLGPFLLTLNKELYQEKEN